MVRELTAGNGDGALPMVAIGSPVRDWIKEPCGASLAVLGLGRITPAPGQSMAMLGANHLSCIWYAAEPSNYGGDQQKADQSGLKVKGEDLSAAC